MSDTNNNLQVSDSSQPGSLKQNRSELGTDCKIPLVFGVAGHRDLHPEALPNIEEEVHRLFKEMRQQYPHTPLALISPLADGADRIVAKIAKEEGAALIVPLPWPEGVFDEEMHRTGSREGFDDLLAEADQVIHLPLIEGISEGEIRSSDEAREKQFSQVGAYVARHSQLLIALWDGVEKQDSGTARVIAWQRGGEPAPFAPHVGRLDEPENGPVYQIATPRSGHDTGVNLVERIVHYPAGFENEAAAAEAIESSWRCIDQFNADISRDDESFGQMVEQSKDWLIPPESRDTLPKVVANIFERYVRADAAAIWFQKGTYTTLTGVFVLMAVAVVCFEFYTHLFVDWWPLLVVYLGLLLISLGWFKWSTRQSLQAKFLDYRSLAEALRVQIFWQLAGLSESVADYYLRNLRTELDWIRQAIRSVNLISGLHVKGDPATPEEQIARLEIVRDNWIEDQREYFTSSGPKNERLHHRCALLSRFFFWLGLALGVVLLLVHLRTHHLNHLLAVLVFVSVAAAALCHEYGEKNAFEIQAKRYDWMRSFFKTAKAHMDQMIEAKDIEESQQLVLELGREALQENAEWLLQHRQRPITPPTV